jgi:hypothetical protein
MRGLFVFGVVRSRAGERLGTARGDRAPSTNRTHDRGEYQRAHNFQFPEQSRVREYSKIHWDLLECTALLVELEICIVGEISLGEAESCVRGSRC